MAALKADKGKLVLDFTWKGVRCREYLALDDTKDGRARARQVKLIVEGEVAARTLDFAARFPRSRKVKPGGPFAPPPPPTAPAGPPTFGTFSREWLELQRPFGS